MKIYEACLLLVLPPLAARAGRRGPHHPRDTPADPHRHHRPGDAVSLTRDTQVLHDTKHLEEDSPVLDAEMLASMTPEELEFHYFSAHDFDKNSKLDGLELLKAVYHTVEHEAADPDPDSDAHADIEPGRGRGRGADDLEAYISLVDRTLAADDTDGDGFVSYLEYRAARQGNPPQRTPHVLLTNM